MMKLTDEQIWAKGDSEFKQAEKELPEIDYESYHRGHNDGAQWARDKACEWVPVSELPEQGERVIVYDEEFGVQTAYLHNSRQFIDGMGTRLDNVTHWQPLPEKPKSE